MACCLASETMKRVPGPKVTADFLHRTAQEALNCHKGFIVDPEIKIDFRSPYNVVLNRYEVLATIGKGKASVSFDLILLHAPWRT